jgi:hypothetical protein
MQIPRASETRRIFAAFCAAATMTYCHCAEAQSLRWKFEVGQKLEIQINQSTSLETEVDLVKQTLETSSGLQATWLVQAVDDAGTAQVTMVIQAVRLKVMMPVVGGVRTLQVDTAAPAPPKPSEQEIDALKNLQSVVGRELKLTITARGDVTKVEIDAATKDTIRQAPQSMQIRQLLTDDGLQELFASGAPQLPEEEIQTGGKWSNAREFANAAGRFRREQSLEWVGRETHDNVPQERIDLKARLSLLGPPAAAPQESADSVQPKIKSQETTGTIWFDTDRGMITQGTVDSSLVTESPYREKTIVVRIKSHVELIIRREK